MGANEESTAETAEDRANATTIGRLVHAVELIASAHASRAREEAAKDLSRMASGGVLLLIATVLVIPIVLCVDAAVALVLVERAVVALPGALVLVAVVNVLLAVLLALLARSRLSSPVLVETRATLKRAAIVLRGN